MSQIKTSCHAIKFTNKTKKDNLCIFIDEYRRVANIVVEQIWKNGYVWKDKQETHIFSIQQNKLYFPSFIDYRKFNIDTFLSARALSSLVTQVAGIVSAECEKQRKRVHILHQLKEERKTKKQRKLLANRIKQNIPTKPNCNNINVELSSKCCDWLDTDGEFDGFLCLKSITTTKIEIKIPIKFHKHSHSLSKNRERLNSFLISKTNVNIRWKKDLPIKKDIGEIIGADQGLKDVLTCSDKQQTPKTDKHGHSLETILKKISKRKKGSKGFKRSQDHRKNFINWSINQLNFDKIKEVKLESIWNIGYKSKTSKILSHWTNTLIRDKVESLCVDKGIRLIFQSSTYRSQRCSGCGVVRKANRKGKLYLCKHCGLEIDADLNASLNHVIDLPEVPYSLRKLNLNRGNGFYWLERGFYSYETGTSLESVPPVKE